MTEPNPTQTAERIDAVAAAQAAQARKCISNTAKLEAIHTAVVGDPIGGEAGIVLQLRQSADILARLDTTVHGDDNGHIGLVRKHDRLSGHVKLLIAVVSALGGSVAAAVIWAIVTHLAGGG